jgi:hypothetical protein
MDTKGTAMNTYAIETRKANGYTVTVEPDEDAESPREWDNVGKMICFHRDYELGDKHDYRTEDYADPDAMLRDIIEREGATLTLPLYLYDHSGITMRAGEPSITWMDPQGWDTSMVGWIADTREGRELIGYEGLDPDKIADVLRGEVETYARYLEGAVYGYVVRDRTGEPVESCWGYFDADEALAEGVGVAEALAPASFVFTVRVDAPTVEQARRVLDERLGHDEDYGFEYRLQWEGV